MRAHYYYKHVIAGDSMMRLLKRTLTVAVEMDVNELKRVLIGIFLPSYAKKEFQPRRTPARPVKVSLRFALKLNIEPRIAFKGILLS